MKCRIALSIFVLVLSFLFTNLYNVYQSQYESSVAVQQVNDDANSYALTKAVAVNNVVQTTNMALTSLLLCVIWLPFIYERIKNNEKV